MLVAPEEEKEMNLIGWLLTVGALAIVAWAVQAILASLGIAIPQVVKIIVIAVIGILCLVLLAQVLGVPMGLNIR